MSLSGVTIPLALAAGAASFLSPCVLPLVPAYLAFLSRAAGGPGGLAGARWRVLRGSLGFVLGLGLFCLTFFYALDRLLLPWRSILAPILGAAVVLLGLSVMGALRLPLVRREARWLPSGSATGDLPGGFLLGVGLAAGWSPCIGPVLGAVLTSGLNQGTTGRGLLLMLVYVLGLGLPFIAAAVLMDRVTPLLRSLGRHQRAVSLVGGAVVVLMGVLVMADRFTVFNQFLSSHLPAFFQDPFRL